MNADTDSAAALTITPVQPADHQALLAIAVSTGLFDAAEAEALLGGVLRSLPPQQPPVPGSPHAACCRLQGEPVGWCYLAPDDHAAGVWNLWWIGVSPAQQGRGAAGRLLRHAEAWARQAGARLLIVETSAADALARARRFYAGQGYQLCGSVPDFYAEGEAKQVFARRLLPA